MNYKTEKFEDNTSIYYYFPRLTRKYVFRVMKNSPKISSNHVSENIYVFKKEIIASSKTPEQIKKNLIGNLDRVWDSLFSEAFCEKIFDFVTEYIFNDFFAKISEDEDDELSVVVIKTPRACEECPFYSEDTVQEYSAVSVPVCRCVVGGFKDINDLRYLSFKNKNHHTDIIGKKPGKCPLQNLKVFAGKIRKEK